MYNNIEDFVAREIEHVKRFDFCELRENAHIHFIGIGGISMSGLAQIAIQNGYKVTGSDRQKSNITDKLEELGAVVYEGHDAANVDGADLCVNTAAVKMDNPEMAACVEKNIRLIDRAEFLGAVMKKYTHSVGVSGTHGKTTTTSMLAYALINAQKDPTVSLGGELDILDGNIRTGESGYFVTEACEYTNSFLKFFPTVALITNIEEDHLDFFSGIEEIRQSFADFAMLTKGIGSVVAWGEDENIKIALESLPLDIVTYGMSPEMKYYPQNLVTRAGFPSFDVYKDGEMYTHIDLSVPGTHNILNALATVAVCDLLECDIEKVVKGLESFKGVKRRFEKKGTINGATVIDDYAHHPTEIKTTLAAAQKFPHERIICIFQPHTYSRTRTLWKEFTESFADADELILTHIYAAREPFDGVTTPQNLAKDIEAKGQKVKYLEDFSDIAEYIKQNAKENDIIFTMGAGTVTEIGPMIVE